MPNILPDMPSSTPATHYKAGIPPNEGIGVFVVSVDVITDGHDERFGVLERTSPGAFRSGKEVVLDPVEPRGRSGREVPMESLLASHSVLHPLMFVRRVVAAGDLDLLSNTKRSRGSWLRRSTWAGRYAWRWILIIS